MGVLERSKAKLRLTLSKSIFCPGEAFSGRVTLDVKEAVTFSSLRLRVVGRESIEMLVRKELDLDAEIASVTYVNIYLTFTGPSKSREQQEKQTYERGEYTFPFAIPLPMNAPPSFAATTSAGRVRVAYTASAILTIPNGFDSRKDVSFRVAAAVPLRQLVVEIPSQPAPIGEDNQQQQQMRRFQPVPPRLPQVRQATVFRHSLGGLQWGKRKEAQVFVGAVAAPSVLMMDPCAVLSPADAATVGPIGSVPLVVRIAVINNSKEVLRTMKLELANVVRVFSGEYESVGTLTVAKTTERNVSIAANSLKEVTVNFPIKWSGFRTDSKKNARLPVPSMRTACFLSTYVILVSFPGSRVERAVPITDCVDLVDCMSPLAGNAVPTVPVFFTPALHEETALRYVSVLNPESLTPVGPQVFPLEHTPYLSRRGNGNGSGDEASANEVATATVNGEAGRNEPQAQPPLAPRPHRATVIGTPALNISGILMSTIAPAAHHTTSA